MPINHTVENGSFALYRFYHNKDTLPRTLEMEQKIIKSFKGRIEELKLN